MPKRRKTEKLTPAKKVSADILGPRLIFILAVLSLILFGWVMVFSASNVEALNNNENPYSYLFKQLIFSGVGIVAAIAVWRWIPYKLWEGWLTWACLIVLAACMLITLFTGPDILGARRWIYIGGASFQPSEFVKIVLVLIVARYFVEYSNGSITLLRFLGVAGGTTLAMILFILGGQNDLGTTIICAVGILALLLIAGIPTRIFIGIIGVCIVLGLIVIFTTGWRSSRMIFLDPYNDGAEGYGAGYQLIRSYYAFAEGGFFGVGLGNSYEKYQYLPEAETDFIFSIIGEELGMFGCIIVVLLFAALIVSGLMMVAKSNSRFNASVSGAFVIMIGFQAFLNIFCVIGFAPTTGKPLPFISAGGSSIIATLVMVGFILAGSENDALPDKYERRRKNFKVSAPSFTGRIKSTADKVINNEVNTPQRPKRKVNRTRATRGVKKNINIKEPGFLDARESASRTSKPASKRSGNSYAYRRNKPAPSFKPQKSALKPSSSRRSNNRRK